MILILKDLCLSIVEHPQPQIDSNHGIQFVFKVQHYQEVVQYFHFIEFHCPHHNPQIIMVVFIVILIILIILISYVFVTRLTSRAIYDQHLKHVLN